MSFQQQFNAANTTARGQNISKGQSQIVSTRNNITSTDGSNSTLVYQFPSSVSFTNHAIALVSAQMYYSWNNIGSQQYLLNNRFTYTWKSVTTTTPYTVTIPNGIYEIADINNYLQFVMIQNGHYLINSAGQNVYYAEFLVSANRYAIQINTFPVPTSLPTGWTAPVANGPAGYAGFPLYPTTTFNPSITLPANFNLLMGYTANFSTSQNDGVGTNLSYFSSTAPQVQPYPSLFVSCSNIQNIYSNPSGIIYTITPSVAIGEQIIQQVPEFAWNKLTGTTNSLTITLRGANQATINILDPTIVLCFIIKELGGDDMQR
jgi:hypothetical protein